MGYARSRESLKTEKLTDGIHGLLVINDDN